MGAFGPGASWDALDLSVRLMQRLEPEAELHVTCQGDILHRIKGVIYHEQTLPEGAPYCDGRHLPLRLDESQHEVWMDNDNIIWALPPGWLWWRQRKYSVLIWRSDWEYYGAYKADVRAAQPEPNWDASAGMWGLPPRLVMPAPAYRSSTELNQDEYGFVVSWLASQPYHEYIYQHEVPVYCPDHNALKGKNVVGSHGVHLNGINRGWSPKGEALLYKLRDIWL